MSIHQSGVYQVEPTFVLCQASLEEGFPGEKHGTLENILVVEATDGSADPGAISALVFYVYLVVVATGE